MGLIDVLPAKIERQLEALIAQAQTSLSHVTVLAQEATGLIREAREELKAAKALRERLQKAVGGE